MFMAQTVYEKVGNHIGQEKESSTAMIRETS